MAYSTCSFNPIEDEAVVASLLSRYPCAHACSRFQSALLWLLHCFFLLPPPPTLYPPPSLSFQLTSPLPQTVPPSLFPSISSSAKVYVRHTHAGGVPPAVGSLV